MLSTAAAYLLALSLARGGAPAQDPPPPPPALPPPSAPSDPWRDVPRGVLPEGTSDGARARYVALRATLDADSGSDTELIDFELQLELRTRGEQQHDLSGVHTFLSPSFVSFVAEGHGMGRGPQGYWRRDGDQHIPLVGREYQVDREAIDEMLAISENFLELLEPDRWRIVTARESKGPLAPLPTYKHLRFDPAELHWLALDTPDFQLPGSPVEGGAARLYRVTLGIDSAQGTPAFAFVQEVREGRALHAGSLCVYLGSTRSARGWGRHDGRAFPDHVAVHRALAPGPGLDPPGERTGQTPGYEARPTWELGIFRVDLRPGLTPSNFLGR